MKVKTFTDTSRQTLENDIQRFIDDNHGFNLIKLEFAVTYSEYHDHALYSVIMIYNIIPVM